jgi:hypothetical protein
MDHGDDRLRRMVWFIGIKMGSWKAGSRAAIEKYERHKKRKRGEKNVEDETECMDSRLVACTAISRFYSC